MISKFSCLDSPKAREFSYSSEHVQEKLKTYVVSLSTVFYWPSVTRNASNRPILRYRDVYASAKAPGSD